MLAARLCAGRVDQLHGQVEPGAVVLPRGAALRAARRAHPAASGRRPAGLPVGGGRGQGWLKRLTSSLCLGCGTSRGGYAHAADTGDHRQQLTSATDLPCDPGRWHRCRAAVTQ